MKSRVRFISELYYPEETSTGHYVTGVAEGLAHRFPVTVITGQPTYSGRGRRCPAREVHNGVHIERCLSTTLDKNVLSQRVVNMLSLSSSFGLRAFRSVQPGDVVIVGTNPPLLPWAALAACRTRRAKCIIRVDDIYPDAAIAAGLIEEGSVPARLFDSLQRQLLSRADGIITMGRCMKATLQRKFAGLTTPITVIPNYADVEEVKPNASCSEPIRRQYALQDKFVVLLAGNLGRVQGLEILVGAAEKLLTHPDIHFLVFGDGARTDWLRSEKDRLSLTNVTLAGARPRDEQQLFLGAGDIGLLTLTHGMAGIGVPSRFYNYMAAGLPVISATGRGSETTLVIEEEDIGWSVEPHDSARLAAAVLDAKERRGELQAMGACARRVAEGRFGRDAVVEAYARVVEGVITGSRAAR